MEQMQELAKEKAEALTKAITSDSRWALEDELMCQVFGFTLYGYVFGVGRVICFMDVEPIQELAATQLSGLGIGPRYATGMMEHAHQEFVKEDNQSVHGQLVGIGHSHFASEDLGELVESVFENTATLRQHME